MKQSENLTANSITELLKECKQTGNKYLPILTSYLARLNLAISKDSDKNNDIKLKTKYQYGAMFYRFLRMSLNFCDLTEYFDNIEQYLVDEIKTSRPYYTFSNGYLYDKIIDFDEINFVFMDFSIYFLKYAKKMISCVKNANWLQFLDNVSDIIYNILDKSKEHPDESSTSMFLECLLLSKIYDYIQLSFNINL